MHLMTNMQVRQGRYWDYLRLALACQSAGRRPSTDAKMVAFAWLGRRLTSWGTQLNVQHGSR